MSILFWGLTVGTLGKVMVAAGVIVAHLKLAHERKIDQEVLRSFKLELWLTFIGLLLIIIGYGMEVYFYGFTDLLTCEAGDCSATIILNQ